MFDGDTFVEEIVVRQNGAKVWLIRAGVLLGALVLIVALWLFVPFYATVLMVITGGAAYILIRYQSVEYEYAFTNGDLDIDKIMGQRHRVRIFSINHSQIQVMAPYTEAYADEAKGYEVSTVVHAESHRNAPGLWFLIYEKKEWTAPAIGKNTPKVHDTQAGTGFLVFEPSKKLRDAMRKYARSKIREEPA